MTWCAHCETSIAKHECEYKNVKEDSIFVKFPLVGKPKEFLIVWTTTPWTIPFDLAVMAGPDIDYVQVQVEDEGWILAKALATVVVSGVIGKSLKVIKEMKGEELEGLEYVQPLAKYLPEIAVLKKKHKKIHTVILSSEFVDTESGSGLVHAAPGSGPEDQIACQPYDIPPFNTLNESGYFGEGAGKFKGLRAKVDDKVFIDALKEEKALLAVTKVDHDYPHCWRCHKPIIFWSTTQYLFNT